MPRPRHGVALRRSEHERLDVEPEGPIHQLAVRLAVADAAVSPAGRYWRRRGSQVDHHIAIDPDAPPTVDLADEVSCRVEAGRRLRAAQSRSA